MKMPLNCFAVTAFMTIALASTPLAQGSEKIINPIEDFTQPASVDLVGCTGIVVGLYPPTVITARHCYELDRTRVLNVGANPEKVIWEPFGTGEFSTFTGYLPGDLVVYIYPDSVRENFKLRNEDLFTVDTSTQLTAGQEIFFCGTGKNGQFLNSPGSSFRNRCGKNKLILEDSKLNFDRSIEQWLRKYDVSQFSDEMLNKVTSTLAQEMLGQFGTGTRLAIANDEGENLSLTSHGDSGGPTFIMRDGRSILVGVNSLGATRNFDGKYIFGVSWRLDHPWSQALLNRAVLEGADIRGMRTGAIPVFDEPIRIQYEDRKKKNIKISGKLSVIDNVPGKITSRIEIFSISQNLTLEPSIEAQEVDVSTPQEIKFASLRLSKKAKKDEIFHCSGRVYIKDIHSGKETHKSFYFQDFVKH